MSSYGLNPPRPDRSDSPESTSAPRAKSGESSLGNPVEMTRAHKAMEEVAEVLGFSKEVLHEITSPDGYRKHAISMLHEARRLKNKAGIAEIGSLRREHLLRFIQGDKRATEIHTRNARRVVIMRAMLYPGILTSNGVTWGDVLADPLSQARRMVSELTQWNPKQFDTYMFARPKFVGALVFLVGTQAADWVLENARKSYTEKLLEILALRSSKHKMITDQDKIYEKLKAKTDDLKYAPKDFSFENLDRLSLVLGDARAAELVAERARVVLTKFLNRNVGDHENVLQLCQSTISNLRQPPLASKLQNPANKPFLIFLLGENVGKFTAKHGKTHTLIDETPNA